MRRLILSLLIILGFVSFAPAVVSAQFNFFKSGNNPESICQKPGTSTNTICQDDGSSNPISGPNGVLLRVTRIIAIVAGISAIIIMMIGATMFIIADGDPGKAASARSTVFGAAIGLIIIVAAQAIISFVVTNVLG